MKERGMELRGGCNWRWGGGEEEERRKGQKEGWGGDGGKEAGRPKTREMMGMPLRGSGAERWMVEGGGGGG
jgi:hypothetical protein